MGFDNIFFISCFLPVTVLFYFLIPGLRGKNAVLLAFSLVFYAFAGLGGLLLMLALALINYLLGRVLRPGRKALLIVGVCLNVGFLAAFKYLNFFATQLLGLESLPLTLAAPLGISFFTFKSISYLVDIYRKPEAAAASFGPFLTYVCFFPQIVTGPITRFSDFAPQLQSRSHSHTAAFSGAVRFIAGLAKKVILAGTLGTLVDGIFALEAGVADIRLGWLAAIGYCLQLFFDFSGYVDMAIGLGTIFGFTTAENFNRPYLATSVGDFWRRWHMTLSGWFKDYVYIPLGGNRKGAFRAGLHKCVVFVLCGLWHGANWTFLLWGLWHGLFSLLESAGVIDPKKLRRHPALSHLYTLAVVCLGFVMFRAATVAQGFAMLGAMFTGFSFSAAATVALHRLLSPKVLCVLAVSVLLILPFPRLQAWLSRRDRTALKCLWSVVLLLLCILALAAGGFAPSIYAQF